MATRNMVLEDIAGLEARFNARDVSLLSFTGSSIDSVTSTINGHVLSHESGGQFERTIVNGLGTLATVENSYHRYQNSTTLLSPLNGTGTDLAIWQVADINVFYPPIELYADGNNRIEVRDLGGDNVVNRIQDAGPYSSFTANIQSAGTLNPFLMALTRQDGTKEGCMSHSSAIGDSASLLSGPISSLNAEYRLYGRQETGAGATYLHDAVRFNVPLDQANRRLAEAIMMWEIGAQSFLYVGHPHRTERPQVTIPVVVPDLSGLSIGIQIGV